MSLNVERLRTIQLRIKNKLENEQQNKTERKKLIKVRANINHKAKVSDID